MKKRFIYFIGFLICALLIAMVYYLQYSKGIQPCLLCIIQRVAYYLLGIICLIATLHNPRYIGQCVYAILLVIISLLGGFFALRQILLQHLPSGEAPPCAPSLNFMLQNFPLHQTLKVLFYGSGDCAAIHWTFLGFSLAWWSLLFFIIFIVGSVITLYKTKTSSIS